MGYFDRVTVSLLHVLYTANQETVRVVRQRGYGLRLLIFKTVNSKVDLGQIRSEEIIYSRFTKDPTGLINRAKRQV